MTKRYEKLKTAGICVICGKRPSRSGKVLCDECAAMRRKRYASKYAQRKSEGMCTHCGRQPPEPGRSRCKECTEYFRRYAETRNLCDGDCLNCKFDECIVETTPKISNAEFSANWRAKMEEKGLCKKCGKEPPAPGKKQCAQCSELLSEKSKALRRKRAQSGMCTYCGKNKPESGKKICNACLKASNDKLKDRRKKLEVSGLCQACGEKPARPGRTLCMECNKAAIQRKMIRYVPQNKGYRYDPFGRKVVLKEK